MSYWLSGQTKLGVEWWRRFLGCPGVASADQRLDERVCTGQIVRGIPDSEESWSDGRRRSRLVHRRRVAHSLIGVVVGIARCHVIEVLGDVTAKRGVMRPTPDVIIGKPPEYVHSIRLGFQAVDHLLRIDFCLGSDEVSSSVRLNHPNTLGCARGIKRHKFVGRRQNAPRDLLGQVFCGCFASVGNLESK
jgi:hypothetical protein